MNVPGLLASAGSLLPDAVRLRRALHRIPEVGLDLPRTQAAVVEALDGLGLEITTGHALSSVTVILRGARPGPAVLLRADMDALPVHEETGLPFASENDGAMHACGHDAHMAMLVSAARPLAGGRDQIGGSVVFMFQPGEESYGGAELMLDEGVLDAAGETVAAAFALHVFPTDGSGVAYTRAGPLMGSSDILRAELIGRGGHASAPHRALDPVPVAAEAILALQTYVARRTDPLDPVVLTIGKLEAGTTSNVIPESASMLGTLRTLSEDTRATAKRDVKALLEGVVRAHGLEANVDWDDGYPVVVNDGGAAAFALATAAAVLGDERSVEMPRPVLASEDFSYVLERVPGAMVFLGAQPRGVEEPAALHSNRMVIDEDAMVAGIALHATFALRWLERAGPSTDAAPGSG
jgi:amidohydrolase